MLILNQKPELKLILFLKFITIFSIGLISSCGLPKEPKHEYSENLYSDNSSNLNSRIAEYNSGIINTKMLATGDAHTCALLSDNSIMCWGSNSVGQLGNGSTENQSSPVVVSEISNAVAISAGDAHTCALLSDNSIMCWGSNSVGQLGRTDLKNSRIPVTVQF